MPTKKTTESAEKKTTTRTAKPRAKKIVAVEAAGPDPEKRTPTHEEVSQLAVQFWIERGRPYGSPEIDWLRAEATLYA
jgi:hypothetical protein